MNKYLMRKGFSKEETDNTEAFIFVDENKALRVPLFNILNNKLVKNADQIINEKGEPKFTKGASVKGSFHTIGSFDPAKIGSYKRVYICEGLATGISIYLISKAPVLVCCGASNIPYVLKGLLSCGVLDKQQENCFVIAADNDHRKFVNIGLKTAKECSSIFRIPYCYPKFSGDDEGKFSDFNDLHMNFGIEKALSDLMELNYEYEKDDEFYKILCSMGEEYYESYEKWLYTGMALHNHFNGSKEGLNYYHKFSQLSDKYDKEEVDQKWRSFNNKNDQLVTIDYIYTAAGIVKEEPIEPYQESKIEEKQKIYQLPSKIEIKKELKNWVYIYSRSSFLNIIDNRNISKENAKDYFVNFTSRGNPVTELLRNSKLKKVYEIEYKPKSEKIFINSDGVPVVNSWVDPNIIPKKGDTTIFIEHLMYLVGEDWEILRDFLAWCVQKPDEKIGYMVLIIGKQGIGKGYLEILLRNLLHTTNVVSLSDNIIREKYTSWCANSHLAIINELKSDKDYDNTFYNTIKTYITEKIVPIREMRKDLRMLNNYMNFIAFSNYEDAITPDFDDRRLTILKCHKAKREDDYYKKLYEWTTSNYSVIYSYLKGVDLSHIVMGKSPMTDQKKIILSNSNYGLLLEELREHLEKDGRTLFTKEDALNYLGMTDFHGKTLAKKISSQFQFLYRIRINGDRKRMYCIEKYAERYMSLPHCEVKQYYLDEKETSLGFKDNVASF